MDDDTETYDEYYIYGIGMIESEFPSNWVCNAKAPECKQSGKEAVLTSCLEIMVSKTPKE